ncbi:hypothetical protein M404DRAFT_1004474 [Pisolithus tinctorius Marx 270]|uniref:Uncharacterized protein n=1 Tax=Pisolithus tinctorius Marx 270 TaxID=870435 RepID=A0A0C3NX62_PISTI|nr:hypothetical protein M404DRAFT_1004474 [Pisolithus tinctorius Marx 270]
MAESVTARIRIMLKSTFCSTNPPILSRKSPSLRFTLRRDSRWREKQNIIKRVTCPIQCSPRQDGEVCQNEGGAVAPFSM